MKRRDFIQISSLSLAALLTDGCEAPGELEIEFKNDMAVGHMVFESGKYPVTKQVHSEYLIVGGGLAGMSAAYAIRDRDFLLYELSPMLGGSSAGSIHGQTDLCHGAHYDLSYPSNYGKETLSMLDELGVIRYDTFSDSWKFADKQYLIPKNRESRTFAYDNFRKEVLADNSERSVFLNLMKQYVGSMPMPTRLIPAELRALNSLSFLTWLKQKISVSDEFLDGLDYHMKDDYGAGADMVSALAGIHYFACRPYYTKPVELFSPPEGNSYFIRKIYEKLPKERVATSQLVKLIREKNKGFEVEVIDAIKKEIIQVSCDNIIYAGHKYPLKYIYPKDYPLFQQTEYAPWVVVNIVMKSAWEAGGNTAFWQNEILSDDKSLLGFVDSKAQYSAGTDSRVLTVYYCYKPEERQMMSLIQERKHTFIDQTIKQLERYFGRSIKKHIEKIYIKQMGHAMPIPKPGYLFKDANDQRSNAHLVYAGVDNGRLPLLFEAVDSGLAAAALLS